VSSNILGDHEVALTRETVDSLDLVNNSIDVWEPNLIAKKCVSGTVFESKSKICNFS